MTRAEKALALLRERGLAFSLEEDGLFTRVTLEKGHGCKDDASAWDTGEDPGRTADPAVPSHAQGGPQE